MIVTMVILSCLVAAAVVDVIVYPNDAMVFEINFETPLNHTAFAMLCISFLLKSIEVDK